MILYFSKTIFYKRRLVYIIELILIDAQFWSDFVSKYRFEHLEIEKYLNKK